MDISTVENVLAQRIAEAMIDGFDRHYRLIREYGQKAKGLFEAADWKGVHVAVRRRIRSYDERVSETAESLCADFGAASLDDATWQQLKLFYIGHLINHKQPELAETFFNSVCSKILHRTYFNNDYIFARPAVSTEYIQASPPTYRSYYPAQRGLFETIRQIIVDFDWQRPFEDLERDIGYLMRTAEQRLGEWPDAEANAQIQVLHSAFYRNKGAYIFGKAINGHHEFVFAVPVLHTAEGKLVLDTILLDRWRISVLFSLSRAYFMVDMEVPSGYVHFLRDVMPNKPASELYTMLGLGKQGKTLFLPRPQAAFSAFRRPVHHCPGHCRSGDAGVHPAVLSLRLQADQGRLRRLQGNGPGHRQAQVPAGETGGPRRPHGRHARVLACPASQEALFDRIARSAAHARTIADRGGR
jgi:isocitrate dehydrogenase kinase/phosphatase